MGGIEVGRRRREALYSPSRTIMDKPDPVIPDGERDDRDNGETIFDPADV